MLPDTHRCRHARQRGLSLVELMISITVGLVILAAVALVFAGSNRARLETERTSRQIENGRYAIQVLSDDLRMAGFLAEFDPSVLDTAAVTTMPDPCVTDLATLRTMLPVHVQGVDDGGTPPTCLTDVKSGSDVLVVRRASGCVAGSANCDAFSAGTPHFQASLCTPAVGGTELAFAAATNADYAANWFALDTSAANLVRQRTNCTTPADIRRYRTHIYYVANNGNSGDGIPTLKRAELGSGFTISPLVEGIESLHFEYGIDTDCNGTPDVYTTNPTSYTPLSANCTPFTATAATVATNWRNVVSVKVHLLARNTERSTGHNDTKTYVLGLTSSGTDNTLGPYNDAYKRHAYTSVVRLANPAGRRE